MSDREFSLTGRNGGICRMPLDFRRRHGDHSLFSVARAPSGGFFQLLTRLDDALGDSRGGEEFFRCPLLLNRYGAISLGYHVPGNAGGPSDPAPASGERAPSARYSNAGKQLCMPDGICGLAVKYMVNNRRENRVLNLYPAVSLCSPGSLCGSAEDYEISARGSVLLIRRRNVSGGLAIVSDFTFDPGPEIVTDRMPHGEERSVRIGRLSRSLAVGTNFVHLLFVAFEDAAELASYQYGRDRADAEIGSLFEAELVHTDRLMRCAGIDRFGEGEIVHPDGEQGVRVVSKHPRMHGDPERAPDSPLNPTLLRLAAQALQDEARLRGFPDPCSDSPCSSSDLSSYRSLAEAAAGSVRALVGGVLLAPYFEFLFGEARDD